MIQQLKDAQRKVVGTKQVLRGIEAGELKLVYIAHDADEFLKKKLLAACEAKGVPCDTTFTMSEIGKACAIQVGAASAGIIA